MWHITTKPGMLVNFWVLEFLHICHLRTLLPFEFASKSDFHLLTWHTAVKIWKEKEQSFPKVNHAKEVLQGVDWKQNTLKGSLSVPINFSEYHKAGYRWSRVRKMHFNVTFDHISRFIAIPFERSTIFLPNDIRTSKWPNLTKNSFKASSSKSLSVQHTWFCCNASHTKWTD